MLTAALNTDSLLLNDIAASHAVFSDFANPLQDLSCGPGGLSQNLWRATRVRFFKSIFGSELCILV